MNRWTNWELVSELLLDTQKDCTNTDVKKLYGKFKDAKKLIAKNK